jgi:hypothetical protein
VQPLQLFGVDILVLDNVQDQGLVGILEKSAYQVPDLVARRFLTLDEGSVEMGAPVLHMLDISLFL